MPIPIPYMGKNSESKKDFLKRCVSDSVMNKEFPDSKRRIAVCFSQWKRKHPEESRGSFDLFIDEIPDSMEIIDLNKISDEEVKKDENKE